MREILFRGQTRKHGEQVRMDGTKIPSHWVYGGVLQGTGEFSIIYGGEAVEDYENGGFGKHAVYTDTLSQYTGMRDKSGKRIFEADIVKYGDEYAVIKYEEAKAMYVLKIDTWRADFDHIYGYEVEVVGNIHDNKELLEV